MNEIDVLLEKYLAGETTLKEESQLKQFISEQSCSEYAFYKDVFNAFDTEKTVRLTNINFERNLLAKLRYRTHHKRTHIFQIASLSVAASVVLAVGFFTLTQKKEAYVIEKGVRYDDMEKAVGCADEAMKDAIAPLKQSMQSLEPIKGLEGSLSPSFKHNLALDDDLNFNMAFDTMLKTRN